MRSILCIPLKATRGVFKIFATLFTCLRRPLKCGTYDSLGCPPRPPPNVLRLPICELRLQIKCSVYGFRRGRSRAGSIYFIQPSLQTVTHAQPERFSACSSSSSFGSSSAHLLDPGECPLTLFYLFINFNFAKILQVRASPGPWPGMAAKFSLKRSFHNFCTLS